MFPSLRVVTLLMLAFVCGWAECQDDVTAIEFDVAEHKLMISANGQPLAEYVFADQDIPRPYFTRLRAPDGSQVSRNHPPIEAVDLMDHATMHPGLWLAFGDLDGEDFWRNKAQVIHRRFISRPTISKGKGTFTEEKEYRRPDGSTVCREVFHCSISSMPGGYLIGWDSTFRGDNEFYFGDQEEMGLGVRLATPVSEVNGGRLLDSAGRQGAKKIWSQAAHWCDYSGKVDGHQVGITLMSHPRNFRPAWWHARNYGFMAANSFGRQAMQQGEKSRVVVKPDEQLRLQFGIWIHAGETSPASIQRAYEAYVKLAD